MADAEVAARGCAQAEAGCTSTEEGHTTLVRAAPTAMPAESTAERTATAEEGCFRDAERELVPLILLLQERMKSPSITRNDEDETARVELKRIKADLRLAKVLLSDMEMSARSMVEAPTRRELGTKVKGHRDTIALIESHLACSDVMRTGSEILSELAESHASVTMIHQTSGFQLRAQRLFRAMTTTGSGQAREKKAGAAAPASPLTTCALV